MDTKKFTINKTERAKGGKNNTQTILSAAGITILGGASAGIGYAAMNGVSGGKRPTVSPNNSPEEEQNVTAQEEEFVQPSAQQAQQPAQAQQPTQPEANVYQPTNGGQAAAVPQQPSPTQPSENETIQTDNELDPEQIANALADEIDQRDIDSENMLTIDEFGTINAPDGTEMMIAIVHTPDGSRYVLADTDGDGLYTDVFDLEGNYVGSAEGNLTASDLEEMHDPNGGYLAMGDEPVGDDPTNGITNTESAQQEPANEEIDMAEASPDGMPQPMPPGQELEEMSPAQELEEMLAQLNAELEEEDTDPSSIRLIDDEDVEDDTEEPLWPEDEDDEDDDYLDESDLNEDIDDNGDYE